MKNQTIVFLLTGLLLATPAFAGSQDTTSQDRAGQIAGLERRAEVLQRRLHGSKIGAVKRSEIQRQRMEIRDLIERLEAGEPVDSSELRRVYGQ